MAAFPAYLRLYRDPFAEKPEDGAQRTEMESGPPKQRVVASRVMVLRPVKYALDSKADYQSFTTWYHTTINRVDWFDWTDPVDSVLKQARIVVGSFEGGKPLDKNLRFWDVTFTLETWE